MKKKIAKQIFILITAIFFVSLWTGSLVEKSRMSRLEDDILVSDGYREQNVGEEMLALLKESQNHSLLLNLFHKQ